MTELGRQKVWTRVQMSKSIEERFFNDGNGEHRVGREFG